MLFLSKSAMILAASATLRKEAIQFGHDDDSLGLLGCGQESASCGAAGEGLAATDARVLEHLSQAKSLHIAVSGNALTLGFETEATIGLFLTGNADVADGVWHGVTDKHFMP